MSIRADLYIVALAAILFFTACNGLFDALNIEYGGQHSTFLAPAEDRHADLIKAALSFPPLGPDFVAGRDDRYRPFYVDNPYKGLEGPARGNLTALQIPPFMILVMLLLKRLILWLGPVEVVRLYYIIALECLAFIAYQFGRGFWRSVFTFIVLGLSYPFLMILCRGNSGALVTSIGLLVFIYEVLIGKRIVVAALCFALAFNCRPNVLLLAPLFLTFGWRRGLNSFLIFSLASTVVYFGSYAIDLRLYPGYNSGVFHQALRVYYRICILNGLASYFNNSGYGAIWPLIHWQRLPQDVKDISLIKAQLGISALAVATVGIFSIYYLLKRIDKYEYAFALSSLYILGSTIVATYHLFFLAVFVLVLSLPTFKIDYTRRQYLIVAAAIFMLVPKNYVFHKGLSFEVILNPLVLSLALIALWWRAMRTRSVRQTLPEPTR